MINTTGERQDLKEEEDLEGERDNSLFDDDESETLGVEPINPLESANLDLRQQIAAFEELDA